MSSAFQPVTDANSPDGVGKDLKLKDDGGDIELVELGVQHEGRNNTLNCYNGTNLYIWVLHFDRFKNIFFVSDNSVIEKTAIEKDDKSVGFTGKIS